MTGISSSQHGRRYGMDMGISCGLVEIDMHHRGRILTWSLSIRGINLMLTATAVLWDHQSAECKAESIFIPKFRTSNVSA